MKQFRLERPGNFRNKRDVLKGSPKFPSKYPDGKCACHLRIFTNSTRHLGIMTRSNLGSLGKLRVVRTELTTRQFCLPFAQTVDEPPRDAEFLMAKSRTTSVILKVKRSEVLNLTQNLTQNVLICFFFPSNIKVKVFLKAAMKTKR